MQTDSPLTEGKGVLKNHRTTYEDLHEKKIRWGRGIVDVAEDQARGYGSGNDGT